MSAAEQTNNVDSLDGSPVRILPSYQRKLHQTSPYPSDQITITQGDYFLNYLNDEVVRIEFVLGSDVSTFLYPPRCVLRKNLIAEWTRKDCSSPQIFENQIREDGLYSFTVYGRLYETGEEVSESTTWFIDRTPPNTTIREVDSVGTFSKSFAFASSNNSTEDDTFQCSVDDGVWYSCTSPQIVVRSAYGQHKFEVRAIDLAGNVDPTPTVYSWYRSDTSGFVQDDDEENSSVDFSLKIQRPMADDAHDGSAGSVFNSQSDSYYYQTSSDESNKELIYIIIPCAVAFIFVFVFGGVVAYARYVQLHLTLPEA